MLIPYESKQIYHITDTAPDPRAENKLYGAYSRGKGIIGLRDADVRVSGIVDSADAGIAVSEALTNKARPDCVIIAVNYAPPDNPDGTPDNHRKNFFCAKLRSNDDIVCGTMTKFEFSYIKSEIEELFDLTITNSVKSQFRSLEILPEYTLRFSVPSERERLIKEGILARIEDIDRFVPSVPDVTHAVEIDQPFQNVKLFMSAHDSTLLKRSETEGKNIIFSFTNSSIEQTTRLIEATIAIKPEDRHEALVRPSFFGVPLGKNVVALASSSNFFAPHDRVPIIGTVRSEPAKTPPAYTPPSRVGTHVVLRQITNLAA
jgi:hypothetical protein